ncbi:MAG TPA: isoaspartyl peptidase/L-asparaginase [Candidatus Acidoferrum sp.]|nr:isoaspartyl peptidase/L-asparaginase [Candidatus Acidoferrum sp.]
MVARIVVHGGAGFQRRNLARAVVGVRAAATSGAEILRSGGSALDAVEAAVVTMEDNPLFNAGKGSSLTIAGTVEMDAAIMDGSDLSAGAVALVRNVKNPIRLARIVMENTGHVLLAGEKAEQLATTFSLPSVNPVTPYRRELLMKLKKDKSDTRAGWIKKNANLLAEHAELFGEDTVGAVAVDELHNFAAAASTGGPTMKLPGRIGDTPQIGSGLYSDNVAGAATVTGLGEIAIRLALSKTVCTLMENGLTAQAAATHAVRTASRRLRGAAGVIAIDLNGHIAAVHNTPRMPWAFSNTRMSHAKAHAHGKIVAPVRREA